MAVEISLADVVQDITVVGMAPDMLRLSEMAGRKKQTATFSRIAQVETLPPLFPTTILVLLMVSVSFRQFVVVIPSPLPLRTLLPFLLVAMRVGKEISPKLYASLRVGTQTFEAMPPIWEAGSLAVHAQTLAILLAIAQMILLLLVVLDRFAKEGVM